MFVISGALEIILLQPSSITVYLNTQMRNRGAVLGPVPFQLMTKIREIIIVLDKCQKGYIKESHPRTAKEPFETDLHLTVVWKVLPSVWHIVISILSKY